MNSKSLVKLAHSREANGFPRDSFILHVRLKRKYNDKMNDILYLNSHWMENDRFTAIKTVRGSACWVVPMIMLFSARAFYNARLNLF